MIFDLQKANIWKRISAALFDVILLSILIVGIAFIFSAVLGYDKYNETVSDAYAKYETKYGITFDITQEEYDLLSKEDSQKYDDAYAELLADEEAMDALQMVFSLTLMITSLSIFLAYAVYEFVVPLRLGNGQTLGKKIFGVGVMRVDGIRMTTPLLFIRTFLGKYTIETMIPVLICIMIFFGFAGLMGLIVLGLILLLQIILLVVTKTNSAIHDVLAKTVTVDLACQMIFEDEEALVEYKKKVYAEKANREAYF